jgi:hypothetical protein
MESTVAQASAKNFYRLAVGLALLVGVAAFAWAYLQP